MLVHACSSSHSDQTCLSQCQYCALALQVLGLVLCRGLLQAGSWAALEALCQHCSAGPQSVFNH